jgi:hypothetical protein
MTASVFAKAPRGQRHNDVAASESGRQRKIESINEALRW